MTTTPTERTLELVPMAEPEPAAAAPSPAPGPHCANCHAPLLGPYCYACGQPIKGLIRHLASIFHDMVDTVFNIDSRIFHTFLPLFFRPGYLSNEYFAGRRVRYVTPFRLYFFLSVAAFFCIQASLNMSDLGKHIEFDEKDRLAQATTPTEVQQRKNAALEALQKQQTQEDSPAVVGKALDKARAEIERGARKRLDYLAAVEQAKADGKPIPDDPEQNFDLSFDGEHEWDAEKNPIKLSWLPDRGNAYLNSLAGHMKENVKRVAKDPRLLVSGIFNVMPQTLFVLLPLFAVLLKILYVFKRRLYMEHLIVALHSHSFILLSMLLLTLLALLREATASAAAWLQGPTQWLSAAIWIWLPLYLLIMQKRVYRQGWIMTVLKYAVIGFCYLVLISLCMTFAVLAGLAFT